MIVRKYNQNVRVEVNGVGYSEQEFFCNAADIPSLPTARVPHGTLATIVDFDDLTIEERLAAVFRTWRYDCQNSAWMPCHNAER